MPYELLWGDVECKLRKNEVYRILQSEGSEISIPHVKLNANMYLPM
jgi:hypothetical protein